MHMVLFFVRYAFYRHESPNPARVAKRRGRDLVTSDGKTHTARKTIPCAFSRTLWYHQTKYKHSSMLLLKLSVGCVRKPSWNDTCRYFKNVWYAFLPELFVALRHWPSVRETVFLGWIYAKENTVSSFFNLHVRKLSNGPMNLSWCQFCTFSHANAIMSHTVSHVLVIWLLFCSFDVIHSVFVIEKRFLWNWQLKGLVTAVWYSVTCKVSQIWQTFMFCWQICCRPPEMEDVLHKWIKLHSFIQFWKSHKNECSLS